MCRRWAGGVQVGCVAFKLRMALYGLPWLERIPNAGGAWQYVDAWAEAGRGPWMGLAWGFDSVPD